MSNEIEVDSPDEVDSEMRENDAYEVLRREAYDMSVDEFAKLNTKQQHVLLFVLMREMSGTVQYLNSRVDDYETLAKEKLAPLAGMFGAGTDFNPMSMMKGLGL